MNNYGAVKKFQSEEKCIKILNQFRQSCYCKVHNEVRGVLFAEIVKFAVGHIVFITIINKYVINMNIDKLWS